MNAWEKKAHDLIAQYSYEAYKQANPKFGKKHIPYRIPEIANALVQALGIHNETVREHEIKRLFEVERLGAWSLI